MKHTTTQRARVSALQQKTHAVFLPNGHRSPEIFGGVVVTASDHNAPDIEWRAQGEDIPGIGQLVSVTFEWEDDE